MYDKKVLEPRLVAAWSGDDLARLPAQLQEPGTGGPVAHTLRSGQGDLVVMGGRTQHDWQHTVPKERHAGARMSVTMRHSSPLPPAV